MRRQLLVTGVQIRIVPTGFADSTAQVIRYYHLWYAPKGLEGAYVEWVFIDGSYVQAHQHSAGAAGGYDENIGKSRAGNTSKVHLAVNAYGLPEVFTMTGGHINDCTESPTLIEKIDAAQVLIADKGDDGQVRRDKEEALGMSVIIPRKKNSIKGNKGFDWPLYKLRHLVENAFARLKQYRVVATRYDKLTRSYESIASLACAFLWLPM